MVTMQSIVEMLARKKNLYSHDQSMINDAINFIINNKKNYALQFLLNQKLKNNIGYIFLRYRNSFEINNEIFYFFNYVTKKEVKKYSFLNKNIYKRQMENILDENYKLLFIGYLILKKKSCVINFKEFTSFEILKNLNYNEDISVSLNPLSTQNALDIYEELFYDIIGELE